MNNIQRVSGLIFVAGEEGVDIDTISEVLNLTVDESKSIINTLSNAYLNDMNLPIKVDVYNYHYRFVTKENLENDLVNFARTPLMQKLSRSAIETLAIVAYRQPITRMGIDEIRGVSSQNMLQKLQSRDLVQTVGHVDAPGRPLLYGVTDYFLSYFGLQSLDDLPEIEPLALNAELVTDNLFSAKQWILDNVTENEEGDNYG